MNFTLALLLLFIGLKLAGCIAWSWWLVLSPLIIAPLVWLLCIFVVALIAAVNQTRK